MNRLVYNLIQLKTILNSHFFYESIRLVYILVCYGSPGS